MPVMMKSNIDFFLKTDHFDCVSSHTISH